MMSIIRIIPLLFSSENIDWARKNSFFFLCAFRLTHIIHRINYEIVHRFFLILGNKKNKSIILVSGNKNYIINPDGEIQ